MKSHRLYELFYTLEDEELRKVSKFINSPIFNRREIVVKLFRFMVKNKSKGWKMEKLFEHLYPNEPYQIKKLHHAHSFLLQRMESYLIWKSTSDDIPSSQLELLKLYRQLKVDKLFNKQLKIADNQIHKHPLKNARHLSLKYDFLKEEFYHKREHGRNIEFNLQELSDMQDIAFMADKLKSACTLLSHQAMKKKEYDAGLLQAVLDRIEQEEKYLEYPAISLYYFAFRALTQFEEESHYFQLKSLLKIHIDAFPPQEKRDIIILTANYCIRRLNKGDKGFIREAFDTYRYGLEKNALIENNQLSRWTYNNIILLGLRLNEFDWVEPFIHKYKSSLNPKVREDTYNFNLSKYYVEKQDYQKAMPLLLQTKYDDVLHNLGAKNMLIKMYFELGEWDALESLIENFKTYISRQKDLGYHKENYLNTITIIRKIMRLQPYDQQGKEDVRDEIIQTKILIAREWLLEQVDKI